MSTALNTTTEIKHSKTRMAILPIGATEQHSDHLPLATDTILIEGIARRVADKLGAYCLPTLPFSISHMHRGTAGTVWLRNSTLALVIRDIATSLRHTQFTELVLLNGHGGNFILTPIIQDLNLDFPDLLTITLDGWESPALSTLFQFNGKSHMVHADQFETSCILYLREELVCRKEIRDQTVHVDRELLRYLPFSKLARKTHTGKPTRATKKNGEKAIGIIVDHITQSIRSTLKKTARHRKNRT